MRIKKQPTTRWLKSRLTVWDIALDALMLVGWTLLGGLDWLNRSLLDAMGPGMLQQLALVLSFVLIGGLLGLPLSLIQTFGVEQRFGFNKMTWGLWLSDLVKGVVLGLVLGLPLLWLILWLMAAGGSLWWLWAWVALVVFQMFVMWIAPNVIMPLFNKFTPLEDESLKQQVSELMARAGFTAQGFFVMDEQSSLGPLECVFHRLWGQQARGVFRHAAQATLPG